MANFKISRKSAHILLGITVLCFSGSIYLWISQMLWPGPALRFDPSPYVISTSFSQNEERDVIIDVVNRSNEDAHILGVREFCSSACFYGRELPTTIPANGRGQLTVHVKASVSGKISEKVEFFTDRPSQPILTLLIEGDIHEDASPSVSTAQTIQ